MTRIKKLLVAGLMAVITLCVSIGTALINISQSIFSWVKVSATTNYDYSNTNDGETYKSGDVLQVEKIPTKGTVGQTINIPKVVAVADLDSSLISTFNESGSDTTSLNLSQTVVDIRNPYGDKLVYTDTVAGDDGHNVGEVIDNNQVTTNSTSYVLRPTQVGVYTVQYAVRNAQGVWTISDIYSINVSKEAFTLELTENNPIVLPSQIDTNQGVSTLVKLPLPKIYDKDGKQITKFVLGKESNDYYYVAEYKTLGSKVYNTDGSLQNEYVVVLDDNNVPHVYDYLNETDKANIPDDANVYSSYETYVVTKLSSANDIEYGLYVEAYNAETDTTVSNLKTDSENASMPLNFSGTGEQYYIADAYSFTAGAGKNIVRYRLCNEDLSNYTSPISYLQDITIEGTTNLNKDDISLAASTTTNVVYSETSLMDKCYLPKVSAVDKNNNSNALNAYYYYSVTYVGDLSDSDTSNDAIMSKDSKYVSLGQDENGLYFIPKAKGTYNIYYNAKDFYNNLDENADKYDYDVVVTDRVAPTLQLTKSYDLDDVDESVVNDDYSYILPTKYYTSSDTTNSSKWTKIAIPAIYTTDSVLDFSDLTITRTITSEDGFKNISTYGKAEKNYNISIQSSSGDTTYDVTVKDSDGNEQVLKNIVNFEEGNYSNFYVQKDANGKAKFYSSSDVELTSGNLDYKKAKTSQVAYITLNPNLFGEGMYTIQFNVSDRNGTSSNRTGDTFTFELVYADSKEDVDSTAPVVKFNDDALVDVVDNEQIVVNKPSIKDDVDTGSSKTSSRKITLDRYYVLIENETVDAQGNKNTFVPLSLTEDGTLTFNMGQKVLDANGDETVDTIYSLANKVGSFKVVCFSYDDFADYTVNPAVDFAGTDFANFEANVGDYKNIGYGEFEIAVKNVYDNVAPKFVSRTSAVEDYTATEGYNQYELVEARGIVFYDNTPNDKITVKVIDSNGNYYAYEELDSDTVVSKVEKVTEQALIDQGYNYKYTLSGVKFTANRSDNYTINYTVTDEGNNTFSYAYVLVLANDKETPVITEVLGVTDEMELGTSKKFTITSTDNTEGANISYQVKVFDEEGKNRSLECFNNLTMTFTPKTTGSYTVQIVADDGFGNLSSAETFVVDVVDTNGPTINYSGIQSIEAVSEKVIIDYRGTDAELADKFPDVELPGFTITDAYQSNNGFTGVFGATGTLTITTPTSDSYSITNYQTTIEGNNPLNIRRVGDKFYFTPTQRGEYTVVYSGKDKAGNTAVNEKTIKVTVGDTEKPVVKLSDNLINTLKNGFVLGNNAELLVNTKVLFDSTDNLKESKTNGDIYLTDNYGFKNLGNGEEGNDVYTNVSVQVLDANNNSVTSTVTTNESTGVEYKKYEFTTAGTYTVNFTATDSVGNSYTLAKTFKVSAVESSASESSKVLGTVLIIVSIAILAGVIIYFVRGTKFLPKRKKAKKDKVQKEENKD